MNRELIEKALYEDKELSIEEVKPQAMVFYHFIEISKDPDAEDTWFQICKNWDINVWKPAPDGPLCMTAYKCFMNKDGYYETNLHDEFVGIVEDEPFDFPVPQQELADFLDKFGNREFYSVCTGRLSGEFCYAEYDYSDDEDIMFKLVWGIQDGSENTKHEENFRISIEDFKNYPNFQDKYDHCQSS